jgi:hypothetical protein
VSIRRTRPPGGEALQAVHEQIEALSDVARFETARLDELRVHAVHDREQAFLLPKCQ